MTPDGLSPSAFDRLLSRSVILPPFLLAFVALVFFGQIMYLLSLAEWVDHTDQVIAKANGLLRLLVDGETGMRGYLVTGEPSFLEPYHLEEKNVGPAFAELLEMVSDNPGQVERLQTLRTDHAGWQDSAAAIIDLRRDGGDYHTPVRTGDGKRRMDRIRNQVAVFIQVEEELREDRTRTARSATRLIVGCSIASALLVGAILALVTRRRLLEVSASYQRALSQVVAQAESLQQNVKQLQGLVPICAWCKKVRDDQDFWHEVEHYVEAHSEARFSHGMCPACATKNWDEYERSKSKL